MDRPSRVRIADEPVGALVARLRAAFLDAPGTVATLLDAVHRVRPDVARAITTVVSTDRYAMHVFRIEVQHLQDPVLLWRVARSLVRCGMTRHAGGAGWIESVHTSRQQIIDRFTSPRAVAAMLRMLATWDPGWGAAAVRGVALSRIVERVRRARRDVADAVDLVRVLAALDHRDAATRLLDAVTAHDLREVAADSGLDTACRVIDLMEEFRPDEVPLRITALHDAVDRHVRHPAVLDERRHWLQVGRVCALLATLSPMPPVDDPRVPPNIVHAAEVAWAAVGLGRPEWGDGALARARKRLLERPPERVIEQACVLLATAPGWAPDLRVGAASWDVSTAPFWLLRSLYRMSGVDGEISEVLRAAEPTVRRRISEDVVRGDWDASQLRRALTAPAPSVHEAIKAIHGARRSGSLERPGRSD